MNRTLFSVVALLAVLAVCTGCDPMEMSFSRPPSLSAAPPAAAQPVAPPPAATNASGATTATDLGKKPQARPDYFGANTVQGREPVKQAISYMQRYTELMEKHTRLKAEGQKQADQIRTLQTENAKLKGDLAQARKECDEANEMLQRLSTDLRAWKRDVLGNRQEIMAALAKLQSRQDKILSVILGEMPSTAAAQAAGK